MHSQSLPSCNVDQQHSSSLHLYHTNGTDHSPLTIMLNRRKPKGKLLNDNIQRIVSTKKNLALRYEETIVALEVGKRNSLPTQIRGDIPPSDYLLDRPLDKAYLQRTCISWFCYHTITVWTGKYLTSL